MADPDELQELVDELNFAAERAEAAAARLEEATEDSFDVDTIYALRNAVRWLRDAGIRVDDIHALAEAVDELAENGWPAR